MKLLLSTHPTMSVEKPGEVFLPHRVTVLRPLKNLVKKQIKIINGSIQLIWCIPSSWKHPKLI